MSNVRPLSVVKNYNQQAVELSVPLPFHAKQPPALIVAGGCFIRK